MGMAASQARLLFITARLHDVELRAQQLQAAKIQLAIQNDAAYEKYTNALDGTTITVSRMNFQSGQNQTVPATFENLTGLGGVTDMSTNRYALYHNDKLMLSKDNFDGWEDYQDMIGDKDGIPAGPESFAMVMMGLDIDATKKEVLDAEKAAFEKSLNQTLKNKGETIKKQLQSWYDANEAERIAKANAGKDPKKDTLEEAKAYTVNDYNDVSFGLTTEQLQTYNELMEDFRQYLYNDQGEEIYNLLGLDKFDEEAFDYYTDLYYQIEDAYKNHSGVETVNPIDANNTEWLTNNVQAGNVTIATWNEENRKKGLFEGVDFTSVATDSGLNYAKDQEVDELAMKKAEAEYEFTLREIDAKETKIDNELAKLETERNALTTQYDSVKKVVEENVERTFGIFS